MKKTIKLLTMQRVIIDINNEENTTILLNLLKRIDFVKLVKLEDKNTIASDSRILFKMSSKTMSKFIESERKSIF